MTTIAVKVGRRLQCDTSVAVGDFVYMRPDSKVDRARSDATATMPAIGFVTHKLAADICFVDDHGPLKHISQTFGPGIRHFISATQAGKAEPSIPISAIVLQAAGVGDADPNTLLVDLDFAVEAVNSLTTMIRPYAAGVAVRDAIYQRSDGFVDKASAAFLSTGPAIGLVEALDIPSVGMAIIRAAGDLDGFSGMLAGTIFILSRLPGKILPETATADPDYPDEVGNFIQEVGLAASATKLFVDANRDFTEI